MYRAFAEKGERSEEGMEVEWKWRANGHVTTHMREKTCVRVKQKVNYWSVQKGSHINVS